MATIEPTGQILGATVRGVDLAKPLSDRGLRRDSPGPGPPRRAALSRAAARGPRAPGFLAALRPHPGHVERVSRARPPRGGHPLERGGERPAHRAGRRRPGLAHRHVLQPDHRVPQRALRGEGAPAQRPGPRGHRLRQHARGLRGPARRAQGIACATPPPPTTSTSSGRTCASGRAASAGPCPRSSGRQPAAVGASRLLDPPHHRADGALLQSGLRHPHQRAGRGGERPRARIPLRASAPAEVPVPPPLDGGRRAGLGPHRHPAQRHRRLWPGRAPPDEALPGDGRPDLRSRLPARRPQRGRGGLRRKRGVRGAPGLPGRATSVGRLGPPCRRPHPRERRRR